MTSKKQLRLPLECEEKDYTITYSFFYVDGVTVIESETEYHEQEENTED